MERERPSLPIGPVDAVLDARPRIRVRSPLRRSASHAWAVSTSQAPPVAVYFGLVLILAGLALVVTSRTGEAPREAPID